MFAAAKVVLLQFRIVVVCGFLKIIAPAQDAMFMHDKPDHRRDIAVSEGVRPSSPQSVRVDSAMNIAPALSVLCTSLRGQVAHLQVATLLQVQDVWWDAVQFIAPTLSAVHKDPPGLHE